MCLDCLTIMMAVAMPGELRSSTGSLFEIRRDKITQSFRFVCAAQSAILVIILSHSWCVFSFLCLPRRINVRVGVRGKHVRIIFPFKRTTETPQRCVYCAWGCGDVRRDVCDVSLSCREFRRKTMCMLFDNDKNKVFPQKFNFWWLLFAPMS